MNERLDREIDEWMERYVNEWYFNNTPARQCTEDERCTRDYFIIFHLRFGLCNNSDRTYEK